MDGEITIGTKLETDKFDKQLSDLEKRIKKEEDKSELKLKAKLQAQRELEEHKQRIFEIEQEYEKLSQKVEHVQNIMDKQGKGISLTPQDFTDMENFTAINSQYEKMGSQLDKMYSKQEQLNLKVARTGLAYQEVNNKVSEYKSKIENVKLQKQTSEVQKLKDGFNNVGSSIQTSINKVARLALGIFGIRSAYMALRRASSDLAGYDKQYATNLEYIRFVLTQAIAPVLRGIVELAAKLLGFINMIAQAWFGVNLFSSGSAENFKKMKSSAGGVSKAVKQIKKDLLGFDEINVLTDQSDTGTSAGAGGVGMPSFDISDYQGEIPEWMKWIADNKGLLIGALLGIVTALKLIQYGLAPIKALGIGLMVWGIVDAVISLLDYIKKPTWENFGKIIQGIGIAIIGLGVAFLGLPAIVTGVIVLIVGTIIKYWEQIKEFLQNGINWLTEKSDWVHKMFGDTIGNIYDTFVKNLQLILNWFDMTFKNIKQILDGIIQFVKGVFTGNWQEAWEGVRKIFGGIWDWIKNTVSTVIQIAWNNVKTFATTVGNVVSNIFKSIVNAVLRTIENLLNSPIRAINGLIGIINEVPGINLRKLNTFSFPRLKVGGIINMPNRGTMVGGSAIGGEAGREGVVPLTDQQAMAELGREIGKNVLVNLTNITSMNGRVISRELKNIQSEQNFAYNI